MKTSSKADLKEPIWPIAILAGLNINNQAKFIESRLILQTN